MTVVHAMKSDPVQLGVMGAISFVSSITNLNSILTTAVLVANLLFIIWKWRRNKE